MSDFFTSNSMMMLERAAHFQWTKQRAILDNISNAETPNYKAKYVTFEEALRSSILQAAGSGGPMGDVRAAIASSAPVVQHVYRAISSDMSRLLVAIRGQ